MDTPAAPISEVLPASSSRALPLSPTRRTAVLRAAPWVVLALVLAAGLLGRAVWLDEPPASLIFDEAYYVNAARVILGLPVPDGAPYADQPVGRDPNREHPPLGKLLMARSMALFGDGALGWRFVSLVAGMASILLLFAIVRAAGGDAWLAVLAAGLLAIDNLALVHSRVGTLDMPLMAFMLLGAWCYLRGWPLLAGVACALAVLTKLGGLYAVLALVVFELILAGRAWRQAGTRPWAALSRLGQLLAPFAAMWIGGLWLLDLRVTDFATPWEHIQYMLSYGFSLARERGPANGESYPWQWLINEVQMTYLRVDEQVTAGEQLMEARPVIYFRGAMNPVIIGAAPLALAYVAWRTWKHGDALSVWTAAWVIGTYLPFYQTSIFAHRISYIFYILPTVPAFTVALAQLLRQAGLPRTVLWGYLFVVLLAFASYFPFQRVG